MPRLVKRMPRFARPAKRASYATTEGAPSAIWAHLAALRHGGFGVDPQGALSLVAYYAGVRVISEDVASLPIWVYKAKKSGGSVLIDDHPVSVLFDGSPTGAARETTSLQWREAWIAHCLGWGNGYAEVEWTEDYKTPLGLNLMHPDRTRMVRDSANRLFYEDCTATNGDKVKRLPAANVLHLAGLSFNGLQGYSPVGLARKAIGLALAAEDFGASLFRNGAIPRGFIKHPGKLSETAVNNLRSDINRIHQGPENANKVAILEEGMDWITTSINPDDAQFLATRQFQVVEIARMLRIPPHKIGDYTQSHLANIEASNLDYLATTLRPWCERVEQCLKLKLLSEKERRLGYYIRHDLRELIRASIKDRAMYYQSMFQFGMSANEIRELEELNPIPDEEGGNRRFRSVNSVELDAETPAPSAPKLAGNPEENGRFSHENGVI